jgi:hypothetical protein
MEHLSPVATPGAPLPSLSQAPEPPTLLKNVAKLVLDVLEIAKKLMKDVVHLWRRKFEKIYFSL